MDILISTKGKRNLFHSQAIRKVGVVSQTSTMLFTMVFTVLSLITQLQVGHAAELPKKRSQAGIDWASWGGGDKGTRYSELDQVNISNAHMLALEATIPLHAKGNYTGEALIVDGLIYLLEPNADSLYAYSQSTGSVEWSKKTKSLTINGMNVSSVNEPELSTLGLAYDGGVIYWYQLSGNLLAINARTGDIIWERRNILEKGLIGGTPPIIADNKIIIGVSDIETKGSAARGYISAYDTKTGELQWRAYSYGTQAEVQYDPLELVANGISYSEKTPFDSSLLTNPLQHEGIGGGVPSGRITFDAESNLLYYGTTSNRIQYQATSEWPDYNRSYIYSWGPSPLTRTYYFKYPLSPQSLWNSALWARDADSGELIWIHQMTSKNMWGYDSTNESILADLVIDEKKVKAAIHVDQNGFIYVLDRLSGQLISTSKVDETVNWRSESESGLVVNDYQSNQAILEKDRSRNSKNENYCPSMSGSKPLQPAAYSEKTGLIYIAGNRKCMMLAAQELKEQQGSFNVFGMSVITNFYHYPRDRYEPDYGGFLKAWDPRTADYKWTLPETYEANSGVLTTKGGLTFYATLDGFFRAVNASTGGNLYTFKMPMKALGNISTWMYQGQQYVGILVGANPNADKAWIYHCGNEGYDGNVSREREKYEIESGKDLCQQPNGGAYLIFSLKRH